MIKTLNRPSTVAEAFVQSTDLFADRSAIKPIGAPHITYAELRGHVATRISVLRRLQLGQGDRLAICLPNGLEWAAFTYAAALLGICLVPLNLRYRAEELSFALEAAKAKDGLINQPADPNSPLVVA